MTILAIDPGTTESGVVAYNSKTHQVLGAAILPNHELTEAPMFEFADDVSRVAIEMVASYGMPVGKDVFETVLWTGRIIQHLGRGWVGTNQTRLVYRRDVKHYLCNSAKAKDANVRQAIIDKFQPTGGGKTPQIGTKTQPGPLFGISKHMWAALGVALTASELWDQLEPVP